MTIDTAISVATPPNIFTANLTNQTGDYTGNFLVETFSESGPNEFTAGLFSYCEADGHVLVASAGQAFYSGNGGSLDNIHDMPYSIGVVGETFVQDDAASAMAIGTAGLAQSDHTGINTGFLGSAASNSTYANIGAQLIANDLGGPTPTEIIRDSFPDRFTAAAVLYNYDDNAYDFNLYALGDATNYFAGRVGIGNLSPASKLDVAGAVNANAYLLNGDTLAIDGAWSHSGNDIYYDAGNVRIGETMLPPFTGTLAVRGSVIMTSDSPQVNYTGSFFGIDIDSTWLCEGIDTLFPEHHHIVMGTTATAGADTVSAFVTTGECDIGVGSFLIAQNHANNSRQWLGLIEAGEFSGIQMESVQDSLSARLNIRPTGIGINAENPTAELEVNGNIKQKITTAAVSNPPTISEVENAFGDANDRGDGWTGYLKDDNTDNLYQIMVVNGDWYIVSTTKLTN